MSTSDISVIPYTLYQGDKFLWGGRIDPVEGSSITVVTGKAQIRPANGDRLIHNFSPVTFVADGAGHTFTLTTTETSDWPIGDLLLDLEVNVDNAGPLTIARVQITVKRTVTA